MAFTMIFSGRMHHRQPRIPMSDQLRQAMDDLGAEPLEGSGFEGETPEPGFSDSESAAEPRR